MREEYISDYAESKINIGKKNIIDRVKMMRIARSIPIEAFAEGIGVSVKQIRVIENYEDVYTIEQECKIADFFDVPIRFIRSALTDNYIEEGLL